MSTKNTLFSILPCATSPGAHLWEDCLDSLLDESKADTPVYLQLEGVQVRDLRTGKEGATVTVELPRETARQLGLLSAGLPPSTPRPRLTQARIQQCLLATSALIEAVHDARGRFASCQGIKPTQLTGLARMLKELRSLPASTTDYRPYEEVLKRRLVRAVRRVFGHQSYSLGKVMPAPYLEALLHFKEQTGSLLRLLADVPLTRAPLASVFSLQAEARVRGEVLR